MLFNTCILFGIIYHAKCIWVTDMENQGMYQGDLDLTKEQWDIIRNANRGYASIKNLRKLWADQQTGKAIVIPFTIGPGLASNEKAKQAISQAISDYEKYTCIRFKQWDDELNHLYFYLGQGCHSPVGVRQGGNRISLSKGCWRKGTVIHEIAHSLGFYHEQSRPDRDNFIEILWDNIYPSARFNFNKQPVENIDSLNTPYDYRSITHYHDTAFTNNSKISIRTKDPAMQNIIGQHEGLSEIDKLQMNRLYKCDYVPVTLAPGQTYPPTKPPCVDTAVNCAIHKHLCKYAKTKLIQLGKSCKRTCKLC